MPDKISVARVFKRSIGIFKIWRLKYSSPQSFFLLGLKLEGLGAHIAVSKRDFSTFKREARNHPISVKPVIGAFRFKPRIRPIPKEASMESMWKLSANWERLTSNLF